MNGYSIVEPAHRGLIHLLDLVFPHQCKSDCSISWRDNVVMDQCIKCQLCRQRSGHSFMERISAEDTTSKPMLDKIVGDNWQDDRLNELNQYYGLYIAVLIFSVSITCPLRDTARDIILVYSTKWVQSVDTHLSCYVMTVQIHLLYSVAIQRDHRADLLQKSIRNVAMATRIFFRTLTASIIIYRFRKVTTDLDYSPDDICTQSEDGYFYALQIILATTESIILYLCEFLHYRNASNCWKKLSCSLFILCLQILQFRYRFSMMSSLVVVSIIPLTSQIVTAFYLPIAKKKVQTSARNNYKLSLKTKQESKFEIESDYWIKCDLISWISNIYLYVYIRLTMSMSSFGQPRVVFSLTTSEPLGWLAEHQFLHKIYRLFWDFVEYFAWKVQCSLSDVAESLLLILTTKWRITS